MLSGETANGDYPMDAVRMMASTCIQAESLLNYEGVWSHIRGITNAPCDNGVVESIASSAVKTAREVKAALIIALSSTGQTVRLIAKYRANVPILAVTASAQVARQLQGTLRSVLGLALESSNGNAEAAVKSATDFALSQQLCKSGDLVVLVHDVEAEFGSAALRVVVV